MRAAKKVFAGVKCRVLVVMRIHHFLRVPLAAGLVPALSFNLKSVTTVRRTGGKRTIVRHNAGTRPAANGAGLVWFMSALRSQKKAGCSAPVTALAGTGDAHLFAIFGDRSACDFEAVFGEGFDERVVA